VSFEAAERDGETVEIDRAFVERRLEGLAGNTDLSKFIL
jgi:ATP-dependent HslUV protease ATP-binding subunit HslU